MLQCSWTVTFLSSSVYPITFYEFGNKKEVSALLQKPLKINIKFGKMFIFQELEMEKGKRVIEN
jgi:hypothetical protein